MKAYILSMFFLCGVAICSAQIVAVPDPTLDSTGLPAYLKLIPQPTPEPWVKITPKQRFDQYAGLTFSPFASIGAMTGGAISQAINSPKEWGQGWSAYRLRVASSYGSSFIAYTIMYGSSAVLKEDNRYFRSKRSGFGARLGNVIASPYVAHSDAGQSRFSTSSFLGGVGGASIPLLWSPRTWQGWNNVAVNYGIWYGVLAGVNLVREFYPSLVRHHREKLDALQAAPHK